MNIYNLAKWLLISAITCSLILFVKSLHDIRFKTYTYSGVIVEKGKEEPTSGYKTQTDAKYYFMYREDRSRKVIRVDVLVPDWYSKKVNDRVSYIISNNEMVLLGNTTSPLKNLYGE